MLAPFGSHFMASFKLVVAALRAIFGMHPEWYFAVVLSTHLVNVALLYSIVRALGGSEWIAGIAAGIWGSTPAFQGTLSWFSAYSHVLSTTAGLCALREMARAAESRQPPTAWALLRTSVVMFVGAATMLTGSITAAIFPAVALVLLPRESRPWRTALWLLPSALLSTLLVVHFTRGSGPTWIAPGNATRVFFDSLAYAVGMSVAAPLVTAHPYETGMGLFAGGSCVMAVEASWVVFSLALAAVVWRLVRGDWTERRGLLAVLGLAIALYASVALGRSAAPLGHSLEWIATRDRYHYDANPGLVIAVAIAIAKFLPRREWSPKPIAFICIAGVWLAANTAVTTSPYLGLVRARQTWTRDVMDLTDAAIRDLAFRVSNDRAVYVRNDAFAPASLVYRLGTPRADFPGIGAYWVVSHGVHPLNGHTIRFVEGDARLLQTIRDQSRPEVAAMFVAPQDVARAGAGARMRTIADDARRDVVNYLSATVDPLFAPNDHALADRIRKALRYSTSDR
jgi:hypothetical protein